MTALFLYDDARARRFEPFALTRPVSALRAGALLLRERWERALGARAAAFIGAAHLVDFEEPGAPEAATSIPAGAIVANARFAPMLDAPSDATRDASTWRGDGHVVAVRLAHAMDVDRFHDGTIALESLAGDDDAAEIGGWWMNDVWHLLRDLAPMLCHDIPVLGAGLRVLRPGEAILLGPHPVYVHDGATVEPQACFDTHRGPVLISGGAVVQSFTRIVGPLFAGEGTVLTTDRISGSSIGPHCNVHGEMSATVLIGYANKGHAGFVGHSYVGSWANLGAGTVTSNLKNTYGPVSLWTPDGVRDTGMQFLGTLIGDHAKTGINLPLTTGTVVGAGANVFGTMPPKVVDPFSWGEGVRVTTYQVDKFLTVAERVMARRDVTLSDKARRLLAAAHAARWTSG